MFSAPSRTVAALALAGWPMASALPFLEPGTVPAGSYPAQLHPGALRDLREIGVAR